jgi:hypothetical protein
MQSEAGLGDFSKSSLDSLVRADKINIVMWFIV